MTGMCLCGSLPHYKPPTIPFHPLANDGESTYTVMGRPRVAMCYGFAPWEEAAAFILKVV
jgi:hypothetical protein